MGMGRNAGSLGFTAQDRGGGIMLVTETPAALPYMNIVNELGTVRDGARRFAATRRFR